MHRNILLALVAAAIGPALAACTSAPTPRTAALYAPKVVVTGAQPIGAVKPVIAASGTYPTFAPPITAANKQMDDAEARQFQMQMAALTAGRQKGLINEAEYQKQLVELRTIATSHAVDMQTQIGN
jgi:hypothetical protein